MPYGKPNPMTQLPPKAPSALVKTSRYAFLIAGICYGAWRLEHLKPIEKKYHEDNENYFAFIKARVSKHEKERTELDEINLQREVQGREKITKTYQL